MNFLNRVHSDHHKKNGLKQIENFCSSNDNIGSEITSNRVREGILIIYS